MHVSWPTLVSCAASPILLFIAYRLKTQSEKRSKPSPAVTPSEVLFFPDQGLQCPRLNSLRGCLDPKCHFKHKPQSLARLEAILKSATVSLEVCMFVIASKQLIDIIIEAHTRGVKVRCISDNQDMDGAVLRSLRSQGIVIRFDKSDYLMHHKFVVVDNKMVLTGSYNFSRGGMGINRENIIMVHSPHIVSAYLKEFQDMWDLYGTKKLSYNFRKNIVYEGTG